MGLGRIAAIAIERVVEPVEGMHRAITKNLGRVAGRAPGSVDAAHSEYLGFIYGSVRLGAALVGAGLDHAMASDTDRLATATAVVNGLWGDDLGHHAGWIDNGMSIRDHHGAEVAPSELEQASVSKTGHIVVLVHGFAQTESCWSTSADPGGLYEALLGSGSATPILVRYNTGLNVNANGWHLAGLLDDIVDSWPVPVEAVSIVGFSMGGLVGYSALDIGLERASGWVDLVLDLVVVAAPHRGSPIERGVNALAHSFRAFSTTRPLSHFLDRRSVGIKDMRNGPEATPSRPDHVRLHVIGGTVTENPRHPVGFAAGDLVVRESSARARPGDLADNTLIVGRVTHAGMPQNGETIDAISGWLNF